MSIDRMSSRPASACPYHRTVGVLRRIMEQCHEVFGQPESRLVNALGWMDWRWFATYIEGIAQGKIWIDFHEPHIMAPNQVVGMSDMMSLAQALLADAPFSDEERAFFQDKLTVKQQHMSGVARAIYQDFVGRWIVFMDKFPDLYTEEKRFHFTGFTQTFLQAFDAVLFTWVGWSANRWEWENMKGDMKKCCLMLARIPTDIQEGFTSSHTTVGFALSESPYMIPHLEEIWAAQTSQPEQSFASVIEKIIDRWGAFDQCPALIDGTLARSFDALFQIYGNIFFEDDGTKKRLW